MAQFSERKPRRGGRVVDGSGLENRQGARPRGFESHPLRQPSLWSVAKSEGCHAGVKRRRAYILVCSTGAPKTTAWQASRCRNFSTFTFWSARQTRSSTILALRVTSKSACSNTIRANLHILRETDHGESKPPLHSDPKKKRASLRDI
jgi:hypothetical protein